MKITFNAFSFLQKILNAQNREYANVILELPEMATVKDVLTFNGLEAADVEGNQNAGKGC